MGRKGGHKKERHLAHRTSHGRHAPHRMRHRPLHRHASSGTYEDSDDDAVCGCVRHEETQCSRESPAAAPRAADLIVSEIRILFQYRTEMLRHFFVTGKKAVILLCPVAAEYASYASDRVRIDRSQLAFACRQPCRLPSGMRCRILRIS